MVKVKICGLTNAEDAQKAVYYGAWAVGFIFFTKSPRYVSPSKARKIIETLPPFVTPVGVFVNQSERAIRDICAFTRIHTIQFHGDESPVYCKRFRDLKIIKAFRIGGFFPVDILHKYKVDAFLFDTYDEKAAGGTGKVFDWDLLKGQKIEKPVILAGGLGPDNIRSAINAVTPYAVDISSGVEKSPGIKDQAKIRTFFEAVQC
jgi:phosphoribosylanthranilate isomerase